MADRSNNFSAYDLAMRWSGVEEVEDVASNEDILKMLRLDMDWPEGDHVPWCSAFVNFVAWSMRLPRSKSLRARSWLQVGRAVMTPEIGFDVVVLKRGRGRQPGPSVIKAPGHVGFFAGFEGARVLVLGGNQSDSVNIASYPKNRVLGYRRL